jgi:hypothetical protein
MCPLYRGKITSKIGENDAKFPDFTGIIDSTDKPIDPLKTTGTTAPLQDYFIQYLLS